LGVIDLGKIAVYPGTFDPVTYGHIHVIKRAARIFDKLIVAVATDNYKNNMFSSEERLELIKKTCLPDINNLEVATFSGLLVDYLRSVDCGIVVRGLRAISDFEMEMQIAAVNKKICSSIETVFLMTDPEYSCISSTIIRNVAEIGGDLSNFVPPAVSEALNKKYLEKTSRV